MPTVYLADLAALQLKTDRLMVVFLASTNLNQMPKADFQILCELHNGVATHAILDAQANLLWNVTNAIAQRVQIVGEMTTMRFKGDTEEIRADFFAHAAVERKRLEGLRDLIASLDLCESLALLMRVEQFWAARDPDLYRRLDAIYAEMQKA